MGTTLLAVEANRAIVRLNDEKLQQAIQHSGTAPLFLFTRYPEPHDSLNPSIQVALRPLGPLAGRPPVEILQKAVDGLEMALKDFRVFSEISATTVSGMPTAYVKGAYTLVTQDGAEYPGTSGPQEGPDVSEEELSAFVKSIEIQP